jgi:hypothetical protein
MTTNREPQKRGGEHRAKTDRKAQGRLDRRRADMHEAEGHAGSVPRGNQQTERELMGSHRISWDRLLGH